MRSFLLVAVCTVSAAIAQTNTPAKLMDAPAYRLGNGTIFDASPGVFLLPNGTRPATCTTGQAFLVGGTLNLCSSMNTWVEIPMLVSGTLPTSVFPSLGTLPGQLVSSQLPNVIGSNTTGNAGTATSLASTPSLCIGPQYATGVAASGNAVCAQVQAAQIANLAASGITDTTNAGNISSGTLNSARLPAYVLQGSQTNTYLNQSAPIGNPAAGGAFVWTDSADHNLKVKNEAGATTVTVLPAVAPSHQAVTGLASNGSLLFSQLSGADILGLATSATTDTTNAANILTGIISGARLPGPSPTSLGGVQSLAYSAHQWIDSISTAGVPHSSQPQASDIGGLAPSATADTTNAGNISSGVLDALRLPLPTASSLGGVQALAPQAHQWLTGISTSGIPTASQPGFADIAGTFSGDLLGSLANPTVVRVNGTSVPSSGTINQVLVTVAANTGGWLALPACSDSNGQHLNYDAINHIFSCGTSAATASVSWASIAPGTNTGGSLVIGSGSSLSATGTGVITANAFSGIVPRANLPAATIYGNQPNTYVDQNPPATPPLGSTTVWTDNNDLNLKAKSGQGSTTVTVQPQAPATHQFVTGIASNGTVSTAQPATSDIQGLAPSATIDTTNAGNITTGKLPSAQLPAPTASTPGGIQSVAPSAHQWVDSISTAGVPHISQPQAADIAGLAPSATTDTTNASNIGSGTLNAARLPPTVMQAGSINTFNEVAAPSIAPAVGNLSVWADSTTKNLKAENETGSVSVTVQPQASVSHKFATGVSSAGVVGLAQPSAADVSGLAPSAVTDTTNAANIQSGTLSASLFPTTIASNTTGNAATATALASTPAACPTGQYATGISPTGAAICSAITLQQILGNSGGSGGSGGSGSLTFPASAITSGTLSASLFPTTVPTSVTSDSNVTGSIANNTLTLGWTGTLPANRLNGNVVQSVTSDSNVTGTIANQALTLGWTGQTPITRGGTGANSKSGAFNALAPTTSLGDLIYSDGVSNQRLPGNSSAAKQYLCQTGTGTSSAAPAWCTVTAQSVTGLAASAYTDTTVASNITSGTLPSARLPLPTLTTPGGINALATVAHQFVSSIDTSGNAHLTQPQASDVAGLAASATSDTTNANNILTGKINNSLLPTTLTASTTGNAATATALASTPGTCQTGPTGQYALGVTATGAPICSTIQYGQIANAPLIPADDNQIANSAGYVTGNQVKDYLPVITVLNNQINTYWDQFEPATPQNGFTQVWTDKVNMVLEAKNSLGYRTITVGPSQAPLNQWANGLTQNGIITYAPIQAYQIQGLSTSGVIDVTNASNITTGTLPLNIFPKTINSDTTGNAATATALQSTPLICLGDQFAIGINANGNAVCRAAPTGGGSTTAPLATTTTAGIVIPSTGLSVDQSAAIRVVYGTQTGTALAGSLYGAPSGVATLDTNSTVPQTQLPYVNHVELPGESLPACNATNAGMFKRVPTSSSAADQVAICLGVGNSLYAWQYINFGTGGGGGGGSTAQNPCRAFTNITNLTWASNMASTNLVPHAWATDGSTLEWNQFTIADANTSSISFAVPQSGNACVSPAVYSQAFVNATSVSIPHNLNTANIIAEVIDSSGNVVQPSNFLLTLASNNTATLTFAVPQSGTIQFMAVTGAASQSFTNATTVNVSHGLNTADVAVAVYDLNGSQVSYQSWVPTDLNNGVLSFSTPMSGTVVLQRP